MVFYPINIKVLNAYTNAHGGPHQTHHLYTLKGRERQKPKAVNDRSHRTVSVPISAHLLSTHTNTHCGMPLPTAHIHNNKYVIFLKDRSPMFPSHPRICPSIWWRLRGHERSQILLGSASRWVTAAYGSPSSIIGMCFSLTLTWRNDVGRRQVPRT